MVSTKMMMSLNQAKSAEDRYSVSSVSSGHSSDHDSRPSTACSSTDMSTPMPHSTFQNTESKRFSTASESSMMSAPHLSTASSDTESIDFPVSKPAHPVTPPALSAKSVRADAAQNKRSDSALHAAMQSWQTKHGNNAEPFEADIPHGSVDQAPTYNAFNSWRSQPVPHQPVHDYHRFAGAFADGASGHSRSASYQSTASSADSWNSRGPSEFNMPLPGYPAGLAASMAQMSLNPLNSNGMSGYPSPLGGMKNDAFAGAHQGHNPSRSVEETRNLVNSLASLTAAYPAAPLGYAAQPMMDPQTLMAYTAAFAGLNYDAAQSAGDDGPSPANKKTNLYKTELCRSWEEKGTCRYGSKCQFAHGQEELKGVSRHPKFKTEICRTFWLHGSCPYGKRCCFLHTTATDAGVPAVSSNNDSTEGTKTGRNAHDPPTSRLQQRLSSGTSSANGTSDKSFGVSLSSYLSSSPQLQSAPKPVTCPMWATWIGSRFGAREQVPPQDAPAPRSRLERLRPTGDYFEATSSMPSTSTATTTRYSPFLDRHQPPHSAFSDILTRSPSQHISKARSANGDAEPQWPSSRLAASSTTLV
ncbi:hypothetical protein PSTT_01960 [Puccinia striiformis]|uniref:C3H1-type domain-containing protein n=1 Tax=Puccinia striiformis TaxID=27350 RepID=A0A2S4W1W7_9BASI|nr:hypothetical protein PSTT_01960 [Puccinia striiformis]